MSRDDRLEKISLLPNSTEYYSIQYLQNNYYYEIIDKVCNDFALFFFCCLIYSNISIAQDRIGEEVMIHTKDQSIYREVLLVNNDLYVRLRIQTNDVLSIPKAEIRRINSVK
ncbi:MAG: hypothetical protein ACI8YQ_001938 [Polaribacter sp.]